MDVNRETRLSEPGKRQLPESRLNIEESHSQSTTERPYFRILNALNHIFILAVTAYLVGISVENWTKTDQHVTFCTIGYVFLMSEAISAFVNENILTSSLKTRRAKSHAHWILQALGIGFSITGVIIMYRQKTVHIKSVHAILGITSIIMSTILIIFGYPVLYATKLRKIIRPVIIKFVHNLLGTICYVVGMLSQCYGYRKKWLRNHSDHIQLIATILTVMIVLLTLLNSIRSLWRQFRALFFKR